MHVFSQVISHLEFFMLPGMLANVQASSVISVVMLTLLLITLLHAFGVHRSIKIIDVKPMVN